MSHLVVQGPRPAILPSASFPPWVQPYLDMSFTAPGAKSCFERVLSRTTLRAMTSSLKRGSGRQSDALAWRRDVNRQHKIALTMAKDYQAAERQ
ncbi:hypothetical protein GQ600_6006 [Phytophthora cactorum]|nr:hypothetical protein GQ600_6006 [Phytophthora cactorum]